MGTPEIHLFLAGDALITEPWSHVQDPAFERLVAEMRAADVTVLNLETVIHEFRGHAQADSGGTYMASPPAIAGELKWAGVDMVAHANNHSFDYGSTGVLETLEHAAAAGLLLAGSGRDLQEARTPRVFHSGAGRVALLAMASTFVPYGKASLSRPDLHGRPGLNPLETTRERAVRVKPRMADLLRRIARLRGKPPDRLEGPSFRLFGRSFQVAETSGRVSGRRVDALDAAANLGAIAQAARLADVTVASIHAHAQGDWLSGFAREALAAGASVVFCHGPHDLRGIELVEGKPIFHGLGDFVFQIDAISRHPAEAYERLGLGEEATADDFAQASRETSLASKRHAYQGCAAALRFRDGKAVEIRLLPVDLQFDAPRGTRGRPRWADPALARQIIERIAEHSSRHGTKIRFDAERDQGIVALS